MTGRLKADHVVIPIHTYVPIQLMPIIMLPRPVLEDFRKAASLCLRKKTLWVMISFC